MQNSITNGIKFGAWISCVILGAIPLLHYEATPGAQPASAATAWPTSSRVSRGDAAVTVIMFVHSECPCSRASLEQLARARANAIVPPKIEVIFETPTGSSNGCESSALWKQAETLGLDAIVDVGHRESYRFGATVSGETFVFDRRGQLLFRGGITQGRGHEGDCKGTDELRRVLAGGASRGESTPTFGCALFDQCEASGR